MIKVRYSLLPEGLHAQARREGGNTILYLRPGLSSEQRREALRRARQGARMGHGPRLPLAGIALALAVDRVRATTRNVIAAVRHHPLGTGMLAALAAGAVISYALFVTVSVRIIYPQVQGAPPGQPHPTAPVPAPGSSSPGARAPGKRGRGTPGAGGLGGGSSPGVATVPQPGSSGGSAGSGHSPQPSPAPPPSPAPTPSRLPPPSPTPTSGGGGAAVGVCVKVGPLGVCLSL